MRQATVERPHPADTSGVQKLYRFDNGYGASVVRFYGSYGYKSGLWELAVVKFCGPGDFEYKLCYDTPITDDVIGYLSESDVDSTITAIENLPIMLEAKE